MSTSHRVRERLDLPRVHVAAPRGKLGASVDVELFSEPSIEIGELGDQERRGSRPRTIAADSASPSERRTRALIVSGAIMADRSAYRCACGREVGDRGPPSAWDATIGVLGAQCRRCRQSVTPLQAIGSSRVPTQRRRQDVVVAPTSGAERGEDAALEAWCAEHLGAVPVARLFEASHLSTVIGVELENGTLAVVKVRAGSDRLMACTTVQRLMFESGFPCAEVLVEPTPFGDRVATAEAYIPRGSPPPSPPAPAPSARLLASLVERTPPPAEHPELASVLPWVGWDHGGDGVWPPPDDLDVDLNSQVSDTLDDAAVRVTRRLAATRGDVIGHVDWEARNLEWQDGEPIAVHDWDSLAIRPESTVAGAAAAVFPSHGPVVFASIEQTEAFLSAYTAVRPLSAEQTEEAWAAGAWVLAYNATKERRGGGAGYTERAAHELEERLRRGGA